VRRSKPHAVVLQARPFACDAGSGWTAAVESEAMIQTVVAAYPEFFPYRSFCASPLLISQCECHQCSAGHPGTRNFSLCNAAKLRIQLQCAFTALAVSGPAIGLSDTSA